MKKAALYCRIASKDDNAYQVQQKQLMDYAIQSNLNDFSFFGDNGESGITFERPMFQKLRNEIQNGMVTAVVVTEISRIARSILLVGQFFEFCDEYSVELITLDNSHKVAAVELMQIIFDPTKKETQPNNSIKSLQQLG